MNVPVTLGPGSAELQYRLPAKVVSVLDVISGIASLLFHLYTLLTQELTENVGMEVQIPLSPAGLGLFGYIMVMAWIGIAIVNVIQISVATTLYRGSSYQTEATKSLRSCRTWLKTSIFLGTLLVTKLVISFFLSALGTPVVLTCVFGSLELVSRLVGLFIVKAFLNDLTRAFPELSQMYYSAQALEPETKRDIVGEAVWC